MTRIKGFNVRSRHLASGLFVSLVMSTVWLVRAIPQDNRQIRSESGDWPCFRGPDRVGVSRDKGLPVEWDDSTNILWKTKLAGAGASSPITFGDKVFVTCYSGYGQSRDSAGDYENLTRHVVCISRRNGAILWDEAFRNIVPDDRYGDFINLHGYASSTPAADEDNVYVFFGTSGARAYSHTGVLRWEHSCGTKYMNFGSAASPVLAGNLLIINASVESQSLIALDKRTGQEVWSVPLSGHSRSTPLLVTTPNGQELVVHLKASDEAGTDKGVIGGVDLQTGNTLWQCHGFDNYLNPSPVAGGGMIFAVGNYPNRALAIRTGGRGDISESHKVWEIKHGSEICTPVYYEGHLYWAHQESGIAFCVDAKTGQVVYQERLQPRPGRIYASGVIADGKLYYVSREDGTYVLAAGTQFKILAHNTIGSDQSVFNATPAISRGQLLLRSDTYLYCIGAN